MTGLVSYGSSDEEDSTDQGQRMQWTSHTPPQSEPTVSGGQRPLNNTRDVPTGAPADTFLQPVRPNGAILGPPPQTMSPESSALSAPPSPLTIQRATIRSLTLPTTPNLDIPQSPLSSPTPGTDQKFAHFLELKKQGVHFNTKLASSSALKNPSLLAKLMDSAGVSSELQYTTTLPTASWDPVGLPTWAYKEELAKAQYGLSKEKEEERVRLQRESIDFVAAGSSGQQSGLVVPKGPRASVAERVMAGLGKDPKSIAVERHRGAKRGRDERTDE